MRSGSRARLCITCPLPASTGPFASITYDVRSFAPSRALRTAAASLWPFSDVCLACAKRSCRQTNNDSECTLDSRSDAVRGRNDGGHDCSDNRYQAGALWIFNRCSRNEQKTSPSASPLIKRYRERSLLVCAVERCRVRQCLAACCRCVRAKPVRLHRHAQHDDVSARRQTVPLSSVRHDSVRSQAVTAAPAKARHVRRSTAVASDGSYHSGGGACCGHVSSARPGRATIGTTRRAAMPRMAAACRFACAVAVAGLGGMPPALR